MKGIWNGGFRLGLFFITVFLVSACGRPIEGDLIPQEGKTRIVVTTTFIGDVVKSIAEDKVDVFELLTAGQSSDEILVVSPNHVIEFDGVRSSLSANPIWKAQAIRPDKAAVTVMESIDYDVKEAAYMKIGLGIDAGGTYTDSVIYDVGRSQTICKSKALTTKWDFTVGIREGLAKLDQEKLRQVEMVSLSTTLATNAIVEGEGQKVGMIIMPPYSRLDPGEIQYEPKAVISGRLEITGKEISPIYEMEIKRIVRRMVEKDEVKAFAVSGYAGAINPAHELTVKHIIREETGLFVTCGHELSGILDFKIRAHTAMLNARIIPNLTKLLLDLENVLEKQGIFVPIVVVKGDGTLMSVAMAKERPVETILSGPAASVAGARHLTGLKNALVVDMGGTTTDTAALVDGAVSVCETGSKVGGHKTHVEALEIRTAGLGIPSRLAASIARQTIIRSKHPEASLSSIARLIRRIRARSYVKVFLWTASRAWCPGREPNCCLPKQSLSSPR